MKQQLEINVIEKTVTMTKEFLLKAGKIGTPEYNLLRELKAAYPDFQYTARTIEKNAEKQTYGNLTYDAMRDFIKGKEIGEQVKRRLAELEKVIEESLCHRAAYVFVKKWFLSKYKDDFKTKHQIDEEVAAAKRKSFREQAFDSND